MRLKCVIEMKYENEKIAEAILKSVRVDDYDFVKSKRMENKVVAEIKSKSVSSLLHTIDDYLSCVSVAEGIIR